MSKKVLPNAKLASEPIFYLIFQFLKSNLYKKQTKFRGKLERKTLKKQRLNKVRMCRKHCKTIVPDTFFKNHSQREKRNQTKKSGKKVWKNHTTKQKKSQTIGNRFWFQKSWIFFNFQPSGLQKCAKCCSRCPFEKRFKFRRLLGRIFRIFMDLGSQIGDQKGSPEKQLWNFFHFLNLQNGISQIFRILMDFSTILT